MRIIQLFFFLFTLFSCNNKETSVTKDSNPENNSTIEQAQKAEVEAHFYPEEDLEFKFISPEEIDKINKQVLEKNIKMPEDIIKFHRPKNNQSEGNYSYTITRKIDDKLRIELTLVEDGLMDDSVKSRKSIYTMNMKDNKLIVIALKEQYKCYRDRGHEHWSPELCL